MNFTIWLCVSDLEAIIRPAVNFVGIEQVRRVLNIIGDSDGQLPGGEQPADVVDGTITFFRVC